MATSVEAPADSALKLANLNPGVSDASGARQIGQFSSRVWTDPTDLEGRLFSRCPYGPVTVRGLYVVCGDGAGVAHAGGPSVCAA